MSAPALNPSISYRVGLLLVGLSAVAWSTAGFFTRLVPLDTGTIVFWRGMFGAVAALLFVIRQHGRGTPAAFTAIRGPGLLYVALATGGMICFIGALTFGTVAHAAIVYATCPFVAAGLGWLLLREPLTAATLAPSGVALLGVALAVGGLSPSGGSWIGDALAVLMTLSMAGLILTGRASPTVPLLPAAFLSSVLSALVVLPFGSPLHVTATDLFWLALFGLSNMGFGLVAFTIGTRYVPAAQSALIGALDTPLAPLWVWLAFGETPPATTIAGGVLVTVAVIGNILLSQRKPGRRERLAA